MKKMNALLAMLLTVVCGLCLLSSCGDSIETDGMMAKSGANATLLSTDQSQIRESGNRACSAYREALEKVNLKEVTPDTSNQIPTKADMQRLMESYVALREFKEFRACLRPN